jgi:ABC-type Fe3+-hydroxamate transport system substrate-binding protein
MQTEKKFTDQLGRTIRIKFPPRHIVSLVPSQTELLYSLGLDEEVTGITKFCIHPESWFRNKIRIGGTKQLKPDLIESLQPDLIIANKEENEKEQVEALAAKFPVWISDIKNLEEACAMIRSVGELTNRAGKANAIAGDIEERFSRFQATATGGKIRKAAYFIWKNPWMAAGGDTFIHSMLGICRLENVYANDGRYPETTLDELALRKPEIVLLSSEPYPFAEKHIAEIAAVLPDARIITVDGELFSWYGSRLLDAPAYFNKITSLA